MGGESFFVRARFRRDLGCRDALGPLPRRPWCVTLLSYIEYTHGYKLQFGDVKWKFEKVTDDRKIIAPDRLRPNGTDAGPFGAKDNG